LTDIKAFLDATPPSGSPEQESQGEAAMPEGRPLVGRGDLLMADLEILVSWSRPASHEAAQAFREWLPEVRPGVKPGLSSEDITKGTPWFASLSAQLGRSGACLICVTPENIGSAWLYFEAGAIAHAMQGSLICSYLIGLNASELSGNPLSQYQLTTFDKDDT